MPEAVAAVRAIQSEDFSAQLLSAFALSALAQRLSETFAAARAIQDEYPRANA
ncbi:MAG: hypothetical protein ACYTXF_11830 [Nostoc sp.]